LNRGDGVAPWKVEGAPGKFQLLAEENISLFLNTHVLRAEKEGATYSYLKYGRLFTVKIYD